MSVVVPFTRPRSPASAEPAAAPEAAAPAVRLAMHHRNMALREVVADLGFQHHTTRTAIEKLRALARHSGMPLPRNPRVVHGVPVAGADNISARSIWDRGEFLAWRDFHRNGGMPAAATPPAIPRHQHNQLRDRLANRARAGGAA
jgi:hypothetical protein